MLSILPLVACTTLLSAAVNARPTPVPAPLPDPMQLWSDGDLKSGAVLGGGAFLPSVASVQRRSHFDRRQGGGDDAAAEGIRVPFEQFELPAVPKLAKRQGGSGQAGEAGLLNWLNIR